MLHYFYRLFKCWQIVQTSKSNDQYTVRLQVGELIMTTNDVHARSDRMKTGRLELLMKMFPGYEEPGNVLDALEELEALNNAHNDVKKVQDCQRRCLDIF